MRKTHHLIISEIYEANFATFLDYDTLSQKYKTLNYLQDNASADIQELSICSISYMIEWGEYEMANLYLDKCEKIATSYNLKPLEAKLILLRTSLIYKRKQDIDIEDLEALMQKLQTASKIFSDVKTFEKFKDALAETLYMQSIILAAICH